MHSLFLAAPPVANPTETKNKTDSVSVSQVPAAISFGTDLAMPSLFSSDEPRRKTYAKESWPGKKPSHLLI